MCAYTISRMSKSGNATSKLVSNYTISNLRCAILKLCKFGNCVEYLQYMYMYMQVLVCLLIKFDTVNDLINCSVSLYNPIFPERLIELIIELIMQHLPPALLRFICSLDKLQQRLTPSSNHCCMPFNTQSLPQFVNELIILLVCFTTY